jgi:hypothetical protein
MLSVSVGAKLTDGVNSPAHTKADVPAEFAHIPTVWTTFWFADESVNVLLKTTHRLKPDAVVQY